MSIFAEIVLVASALALGLVLILVSVFAFIFLHQIEDCILHVGQRDGEFIPRVSASRVRKRMRLFGGIEQTPHNLF